MSAVSAWIMSILGIVIVGTLIDLVLPSGRINKFIKSMFATMTVLVIVLPIPSLIKNNFKFDESSLVVPQFTLDESYLKYAESIKMRFLAKGVEEKLAEEGLKNVHVEIEGNFENSVVTINLVRINLSDIVINENLANINKYELVWDLVTDYLKIEKGVILING